MNISRHAKRHYSGRDIKLEAKAGSEGMSAEPSDSAKHADPHPGVLADVHQALITSGKTMLPGSLAIPAVYWWSANRIGLAIGMGIALAIALPVLNYLKRLDLEVHPNPVRALAIANGIANGIWALLPIWMMPNEPANQYLVIALPFAMLVTNLAVTAPERSVYFAGQIPLAIGAMVAFIVFADGNTKWAAAVIAVTVLTLDGLAQDWRKTARRNADLQEKNQRLVRDLEKSNAVLAHRSNHDALTGLPNRRAFTEFIADADGAQSPSMLLIDLDHFKTINDEHGHQVGDELLVAVGERLRSVTPHDGFLSRLGGDEFAIAWKHNARIDDLHQIATQVNEQLRETFTLQGASVCMSASIGIASVLGDDSPTAETLRNADRALYVAKANGGDQAVAFEPHDIGRSIPARSDRAARLGLDPDLHFEGSTGRQPAPE